jgi:hypothetical protein
MQPVEVYSSLYYDTKIRAVVIEEKGDQVLSWSENLSLIKAITHQLFADETPTVKEEVAAKLRGLKEARERGKEDGSDYAAHSSDRHPEEYQQYVPVVSSFSMLISCR